MIILRQNSDYEPLTWKGLKLANHTGYSASATCVNGHTCTLTEHEIADDGTVTPSLVCPYEGCTWHEFVKLEGWQVR